MADIRRIALIIDSRGAAAGAAQYQTAGAQIIRANQALVGSQATVDASLAKTSSSAVLAARNVGAFAAVMLGISQARSAVRTITEFETSMSRLQAVSGKSAAGLRELRDEARDLGRTTRFTATQVAEAQVALAQLGQSQSEILESTQGALNLALAGQIAPDTAAERIGRILKAFRLEAEESSRVVDIIASTSTQAVTNVDQLSRAFGVVAGSASNLGVSVEDTSAALAILANNSLLAEKGGRALDAFVRALLSPTEKAADALARLGLSVEDVSLRENGLLGVVQQLSDAGAQVEDFGEIFDSFGARAAVALTQSNDELQRLRVGLDDAGGAATQMARVMDDNIGGAGLRLKSAFQDLQLEVGEGGLTASLRDLTESLASLFRSDEVQTFARLFGRQLGGALDTVATTIKIIESGSRGLADTFRSMNMPQIIEDWGNLADELGYVNDEMNPLKEGLLIIHDGFVLAATAARVFYEIQKTGAGPFGSNIVGITEQFKSILDDRLLSESLRAANGLGRRPGELPPNALGADANNRTIDVVGTPTAAPTRAPGSRDALGDFLGTLEQEIIDVQDLTEALKEGESAYRQIAAAVEIRNELASRGIDVSQDELDLLVRLRIQLDEAQRAYEALVRSRESVESFGQQVGGTAADALFEFVSAAESAEDAAESLVRSLSRLIFDQIVGNALEQFVGNLFKQLFDSEALGAVGNAVLSGFAGLSASAKGNAFDQGHVVPFASGGVLSGPVTFPLAGGRLGLAGEAGPEGILPLGRDSSGRLGVRIVGGGGGFNVTQVINVAGGNNRAARLSARQLAERAAAPFAGLRGK